ncbi:MAG TPA: tetraacyldisaccharide 4'-kinase [Bryobacteraceae bacterium]|nr:tetraacyldisaccharide 4'-kinase [Bryobacteraceae bacterium]
MEIALSPAIALYLLYRGLRDPRYFAGLAERFGRAPGSFQSTAAGGIWFHAVSVGEVLSAAELVRRVREMRPATPVYVSTSTLAGRALAQEKFGANSFFAPLDFRWMVRRVLRRLRPSAVVILETEIWPNLYRESKRAGAALLVVNARISDRALPRYRRFRGFFRHALQWPDAILAQSEQDARRFQEIGRNSVGVAGNLKYDLTPPRALAREIADFLDGAGAKKIFIAASTMTDGVVDEDDAVIAAIPASTDVLTILAPRKPERFGAVAEKLERAGIAFGRRSAGLTGAPARVLLLDSIGELAALFERADAVFMGGTLADRGGHNILEPAFFGKPVIMGPHMENFAEIAREFREADAVYPIDSVAELRPAISKLLANPGDYGARAKEIAISKRGAGARMTEAIVHAADRAIPNPSRTIFARAVLTPLSWVWRAGNRVNAMRKTRALETPVVSIGALSMGGAGKTPVTAHLARRLREAGRNPAILTRGYKRLSREPVIVARGETADRRSIGDEASIFAARGDAHIGVGADRYAVGRRMEKTLAPDIFLLDDGFEHRRLARRHDIVLIDATDPLGGGVFPLGRLREPLHALRRAGTILLTRCESRSNTAPIEALLKRYNATIFRARVVPLEWISLDGAAEPVATKFARAGAFCGLGSPAAFWRTLENLEIETDWRREFMDHHRYSPHDLARLGESAEIVLTTEKDAMNLPTDAARILGRAKLYFLRIGIEIENEAELMRRIQA